eukprot:Platyproteum_vivax@DN14999_c0_g1_i1.p1
MHFTLHRHCAHSLTPARLIYCIYLLLVVGQTRSRIGYGGGGTPKCRKSNSALPPNVSKDASKLKLRGEGASAVCEGASGACGRGIAYSTSCIRRQLDRGPCAALLPPKRRRILVNATLHKGQDGARAAHSMIHSKQKECPQPTTPRSCIAPSAPMY